MNPSSTRTGSLYVICSGGYFSSLDLVGIFSLFAIKMAIIGWHARDRARPAAGLPKTETHLLDVPRFLLTVAGDMVERPNYCYLWNVSCKIDAYYLGTSNSTLGSSLS